jgi:hypothetical protein
MKIKLIKEKTFLSDARLLHVEKIVNTVITSELKHLYQMRIFVLDKQDLHQTEDDHMCIVPDYLGCFIKNVCHDDNGNLVKTARNEDYPYIEIYPSRIKKALKNHTFETQVFETLMAKVIVHELAHAFMFPLNRDATQEDIATCEEDLFLRYYKDGVWYKTIEESLANWVAYNQNWNYQQRERIRAFIALQPSEYKHALGFIHVKTSPFDLALQWKNLKCDEGYYFINHKKATELSDLIITERLTFTSDIQTLFDKEMKELYESMDRDMKRFVTLMKIRSLK